MDLRSAREKTIRDHMQLENVGDWEAVLATFENPRYESRHRVRARGPKTIWASMTAVTR